MVEVSASHFNLAVLRQAWGGSNDLVRVPDAERAQLLQHTKRWKQDPRLAPLRLTYRMTASAHRRAGLADNLILELRRS